MITHWLSIKDVKVKIICPVHGVFEQSAGSHIGNKQGCAARSLSINQSNIIACCKGRLTYTGRHHDDPKIKLTWKYV